MLFDQYNPYLTDVGGRWLDVPCNLTSTQEPAALRGIGAGFICKTKACLSSDLGGVPSYAAVSPTSTACLRGAGSCE